MDYAPFFAQAQQPFFGGMTMNSPSTYNGEDKIGHHDGIDASFFSQHSFDDFRFSPPHMPSTVDMNSNPPAMSIAGSIDHGVGHDGTEFMHDGSGAGFGEERRGSSEEKENVNLTPAQSRRKAQNRAAQRAFRERKEKHVKDLEIKLTALESSASVLASDNHKLKLALQQATTENEILRASSRPSSMYGASHPMSPNPPVEGEHSKPVYNNATAYSVETDGALLPASSTWDLIQSHDLVRQGLVDIADVCERLRGSARCDGSGPAFAEREVRQAIEDSRRACGQLLV